jgi:hypothetical protein
LLRAGDVSPQIPPSTMTDDITSPVVWNVSDETTASLPFPYESFRGLPGFLLEYSLSPCYIITF